MQDPKEYDWIPEPFSATPPADLNTLEEEQLIDVTSDSTMRLMFQKLSFAEAKSIH